MESIAKLFKALGEETRLRILKMLQIRPLCNCEVQDILGLAPSTISKHLGLLREAGLVEDRREGKWVFYQLSNHPMTPTGKVLLEHLIHHLENHQQVLDDREKVIGLSGQFNCSTKSP